MYREVIENIEKDLTFVGVVNTNDILREGSNEFVKNCQMAGIKVDMLSGDTKKKCLTVGWQTGIIEKNTGFYDLIFKDEADGVSQIKAILKEMEKFKKLRKNQ